MWLRIESRVILRERERERVRKREKKKKELAKMKEKGEGCGGNILHRCCTVRPLCQRHSDQRERADTEERKTSTQ